MSSENEKDLGKGIENFEQEVENLKNKEFKIFGIKVTAITISMAIGLLSSGIGALYGAFVAYQDYMNMKEKIENYSSPDLSGIEQKIAVADETINKTKQNVDTSVQYTQDIKNDLKNDIRALEKVVENLERSNREFQRDTSSDIKDVKKEVELSVRDIRRYSDETQKNLNDEMVRLDKETTARIKQSQKEVEDKLQKALDNPLAN